MDTTTLVIGIVILALLILTILALGRRVEQSVRPALRQLTPEAKGRYGAAWGRIESHFVDAPQEAVREADALVLALLGEREHPLADERLPREMRRARRAAAGKEARGTEGLRIAMLRYRAVVEEMAGKPVERVPAGDVRREIAS